ncbi:MAG: hypothetical protein RL268_2511, partial [Pseudomonadota bacterium]
SFQNSDQPLQGLQTRRPTQPHPAAIRQFDLDHAAV